MKSGSFSFYPKSTHSSSTIQPLLSVSIDFPIQDISYKSNCVFGYLYWLLSLSIVFEVHPFFIMCQYFIFLCGQILLALHVALFTYFAHSFDGTFIN